VNRPRIGFDVRYINDRYHGIGRYAFNLVKELGRLAPEIQFVLFTGKGTNTRFKLETMANCPNVEFTHGPWPLFWPTEHLLWPGILRKYAVDLFHTPYFAIPLTSQVPKFLTIHDLIFERFPGYMPDRWAMPYYRSLTSGGMQQAARVITISQATAEDIRKYYRVPDQKIRVIPEGVDPVFQPIQDPSIKARAREQYFLQEPFILSVGARRPHKNLSRLVKAFSMVAPMIDHDLVFIGPADRRFPDEAYRAAIELQMIGRVRFLNWVPEEDLSTLYSLADLVVIPSLVEGFGLPALEAMACGTPVVASNRSALPEVVSKAGLLVDPEDENDLSRAIYDILKDQGLWLKMSVAGLKRAADFSWGKTAQAMLRVYQEILA